MMLIKVSHYYKSFASLYFYLNSVKSKTITIYISYPLAQFPPSILCTSYLLVYISSCISFASNSSSASAVKAMAVRVWPPKAKKRKEKQKKMTNIGGEDNLANRSMMMLINWEL